MFEDLLNGIFDRNGLYDTEAKAQYLGELRPYAKQLWESYRTQNVTTDYSDVKIQEAYLLRYFPFYTLPVVKELDALRTDGVTLPEVELLDACFLGCGPGPEVIGLMQQLRNSEADTTMLTAKMVDISAAAWSHSREIVRDFLAEPLWESRLVEYESFTASLSDTQTLRQMDLEGCHLVVVQNCLNEVPYDARSKVVDNILEVFGRLSPGAIALVIDRDGYRATREMMKKMHKLAAGIERLTPIGDADPPAKQISCAKMLRDVPSIITDNVLHRSGDPEPAWDQCGLIFSHSVKYICTAFQVGAVPATNKVRL
jgi:hypothetical protein